MLRVAQKAVMLIEPIGAGPRHFDIKLLAKKLLRRQGATDAHLFEPVGNFIFRTSPTEMAKMLTALNYPCMAVKKINAYNAPPRMLRLKYGRNKHTFIYLAVITAMNVLARLGLIDWGVGGVILFKEPPSAQLRKALSAAGYRVQDLPRNPYL